jgi:ribonucleoside-diphosphate reductase alpha chain
MAFQDALYQLGIPYDSDAAVEFADKAMEIISYQAILSSAELAAERGTYPSFPGSLWEQGILPVDSIKLLATERGEHLSQNQDTTLDWQQLRTKVRKGMRNSNVLAIAPTATIANICGVTQSIEPTYQNLYVKSNLSGEFTVINPYLIAELKKAKVWDEAMIGDIKYYEGDVKKISRIPDNLKKLFVTAFDIDSTWLIKAASRRQKWLDQAQSLNIYMAAPSGKKLDATYRLAWESGLKTTYYLRSLGATAAEKSTVHDPVLNKVSINQDLSCRIDNPECEACQ